MVKNNKGFTLVELLAVIVILAVILVIAVPQIMNVITESRKGALASSAKLIASSAETAYISNQTLGIEKTIECSDVSSYTEEDYTCSLKFVDGKAKVTLEGKGKFEGMYVCGGTKEGAEATEEACPTPFEEDDWSTIKAAVTAGDTSKYKVGDTRPVDLGSLGEHTLRIANNSHYGDECKAENGKKLESQTACGFVIEFADIITTHNMNDTDSNEGGWEASAMRGYVNGKIYEALAAAIGDIIIPTTVVSGHGTSDEKNFTTIDNLYILSPKEVYGTSFTSSLDKSIGTSRQLDYYANYVNEDGTKGVTTLKYAGAIKKNSSNSASYWWLRSARSYTTSAFFVVRNDDTWTDRSANFTLGVSPAFRLG